MDRIQHSYIDVRGVKLHVAEIETEFFSSCVLTWFPENLVFMETPHACCGCCWISSNRPDLRGYGASEPHLTGPWKGIL
ncbi:hypothetical protein SLEP1_g13513 [Rubroshorea leprosula]|uniref:Uncharacterized protein n=1 Tax=Rubroshorea leprosula TaxID=152421 RepID=A0AAV5IG67_9ROSI|nr:hypothetical protein SLEP1_g13513 [Rubroshorea leprosula]